MKKYIDSAFYFFELIRSISSLFSEAIYINFLESMKLDQKLLINKARGSAQLSDFN